MGPQRRLSRPKQQVAAIECGHGNAPGGVPGAPQVREDQGAGVSQAA